MDDDRNACLEAVLEGYRVKYDSGDKSALLDAVECCAMYQLVMPEWVAYWFTDSHRKWKNFAAKTLDEAFAVERKNFTKEKKWLNKAGDVYLAFLAAERQGRALDTKLAEEIAAQFFINRNDAWGMYKEIRNNTEIGRCIEPARKKQK